METGWYQHPETESGPIISSRVRLARNFKKYPFRARLSRNDAHNVIQEATDAVKSDRSLWGDYFKTVELTHFNEIDRRMLMEKHIISREFAESDMPKSLLLQHDYNLSIMLNEEDHIRIQAFRPGSDIKTAWENANRIDDLIEEWVEYAFDDDYGYLTGCITNVGTGMRASYMMHLPMHEKTGRIKQAQAKINESGMIMRGLHGEGSKPLGSIYQISNQVTLGKSEEAIIAKLQTVVQSIAHDEEQLCRKLIAGPNKNDLLDNMYRAYGLLANSRRSHLKEAMHMLSELRIGYVTGLLDKRKPAKGIYQIMIEIQPGHLQRLAGVALNDDDLEIARSEFLREMFY